MDRDMTQLQNLAFVYCISLTPWLRALLHYCSTKLSINNRYAGNLGLWFVSPLHTDLLMNSPVPGTGGSSKVCTVLHVAVCLGHLHMLPSLAATAQVNSSTMLYATILYRSYSAISVASIITSV
jgi:hypothetical protein